MTEMNGDVVRAIEQPGAAPTGNSRIDEAVARLGRIDELPVEAHPDIYDEIHTGLRDALANAGRDEDPARYS